MVVTSPVTGRPQAETETADAEDGLMTALEHRIDQMKRLVAASAPGSHAEALKILREAFPDASLAERIAALSPGGEFSTF